MTTGPKKPLLASFIYHTILKAKFVSKKFLKYSFIEKCKFKTRKQEAAESNTVTKLFPD